MTISAFGVEHSGISKRSAVGGGRQLLQLEGPAKKAVAAKKNSNKGKYALGGLLAAGAGAGGGYAYNKHRKNKEEG